jgi:5-methylcytosine-specific restriction endonuclease McrA
MAANPRLTPKDVGLIKGYIRKTFARSDLHKDVLAKVRQTGYVDLKRPRVTKWGYCETCGVVTPEYQLQVDHIDPVIPVTMQTVEVPVVEIVNRTWCLASNLKAICKECHIKKSTAENQLRREHRNGKVNKKDRVSRRSRKNTKLRSV